MREEYVSKKGLSTFSGHFFGFQRRQARDTGGNGPRLKIYDPNMVTSSFDCVRKTEKVRQITFKTSGRARGKKFLPDFSLSVRSRGLREIEMIGDGQRERELCRVRPRMKKNRRLVQTGFRDFDRLTSISCLSSANAGRAWCSDVRSCKLFLCRLKNFSIPLHSLN